MSRGNPLRGSIARGNRQPRCARRRREAEAARNAHASSPSIESIFAGSAWRPARRPVARRQPRGCAKAAYRPAASPTQNNRHCMRHRLGKLIASDILSRASSRQYRPRASYSRHVCIETCLRFEALIPGSRPPKANALFARRPGRPGRRRGRGIRGWPRPVAKRRGSSTDKPAAS